MLSRNQPLPSPDEILQVLLAEWRQIAMQGNDGITTTQLHKLARQGIRKLLNGRQVPEIVIGKWIEAVEHDLDTKQYAEVVFARGGIVLTPAGLEASRMDRSSDAGSAESDVVV